MAAQRAPQGSSGGFLPQPPVLPSGAVSPEMLWAVGASQEGHQVLYYGGHRASLGAQQLNASAQCWRGREKPGWRCWTTHVMAIAPQTRWSQVWRGLRAPRDGVWGTTQWDQHSYHCPSLQRTCPETFPLISSPTGLVHAHLMPWQVSSWRQMVSVHPSPRSQLAWPGLLSPLLLLSSPQPHRGWPHCSCRGTAVSCSSKQCPEGPQHTVARLQVSP